MNNELQRQHRAPIHTDRSWMSNQELVHHVYLDPLSTPMERLLAQRLEELLRDD